MAAKPGAVKSWGEPPNNRRGPSVKHGALAAELKTRPGVWAHALTVGTARSAASTAQAVRSARLSAYAPAGSFDARSRTVSGEYRIYIRYLGGEK